MKGNRPLRLPLAAVCLVVVAASCSRQTAEKVAANADDQKPAASAQPSKKSPQRISSSHLPNAYRLHAKVISGGLPDGDAAFEELRDLGVRTIITVDGAKPDVATAGKYGLRYVHLPHGYDGISATRAKELAKAVRDLPGPVYIHCHHGKHRSPAAATVACVSLGLIEPADSLVVLKTAGTSENYRGLYRAVTTAQRVDDKLLDALAVEFRETAELPPMAEAMVAIEHTHDQLKSLSQTDWLPPRGHPDLDAAHESLLLKEHFVELARTADVQAKPARFRELLKSSEMAASELEIALRMPADRKDGKSIDGVAAQSARAARATREFDRITRDCAACHREFRDVPRE